MFSFVSMQFVTLLSCVIHMYNFLILSKAAINFPSFSLCYEVILLRICLADG